MRRRLAAILAAVPFFVACNAHAASNDPLADLLGSLFTGALPGAPVFNVKATLYHAGARGVGALDSLGCKVVPMRTIAVDPRLIPKRTVIFIKETVGLTMPDGATHDGYWYASDVGSAIKGQRIDLYTGHSAASMKPMQGIDLSRLTAVKVGRFQGCPPK
jgi:3D (Asp-Asp-Asp) domain-containing protein